ncbi:MAG: aminotransferase class I/II-fold pyridoxal phosphate-dependent enzyme [Peptoniphilaceae bacterium]
MKRYIYDELNKIKKQVSFSMPGHKSKNIFDFDLTSDLTETITTDNLLNPDGIIKKSQEEVAKIYGVKKSFYVPNGSTSALHIALSIVTKPGDRVLMQRNSHLSIYNALVLCDLNPSYIYANYNEDYNLITGIEPKDLERELSLNKNIKAVVLVSPNYFGICLKLKEISEIVHSYGAYLIVDEAHGTHLNFTRYKEYSAINYADIIVHSTHKTTPSLTQSALLHINTDKIETKEVLKYMKLFLSTSPSYILMQSSEFSIDYMEKRAYDLFEKNLDYINKLKKNLKNVKFFTGDRKDTSIGCVDLSKILFSIKGRSGFEIVKNLFLRYNIRLEMGDLYYALAISSIINDEEDFNKLRLALGKLSDENLEEKEGIPIKLNKAKIKLKPREAFYRDKYEVSIDNSINKISASLVSAYPPGIPLLVPGELIEENIIKEIKAYIESGIEVVGIYDNKIEVVK